MNLDEQSAQNQDQSTQHDSNNHSVTSRHWSLPDYGCVCRQMSWDQREAALFAKT